MPNLLFAGMSGIGKTACALALGREIFGDTLQQNFLELNASDERGIDVIRGKIKDFAAILPYGGARFKIIFLDECDSMTRDAQSALRRTMETYSATARFILSANYSSKIIEPIQSRCALFRFKPLSEAEITHRLKHMAGKEGLDVEEDGYKALVYASEGDMRRAINFLQTAGTLGEKIGEETVFRTASKAKPKEARELIELGLAGDFEKARKRLDALLFEYGMSGEDVLLQLYREVVASDMDQRLKVQLIDRIGEYNFRVTEGANERIQLEALLAYLVLLGSGNGK
jgi:replication factor C small subunit